MQKFLPHVLVFGLVSLTQACGETVNFETQEKIATANGPAPAPGIEGGDAIEGPEGGMPGEELGTDDPGSMPPAGGGEIGTDGLKLACHTDKVVALDETLLFPEIPAGTTCRFGEGENLSRVNGQIRAYLKQSQTVTLPEGASLCGFSLEHDDAAMRYDDEMFFSVNERLLLATKDYTDYFTEKNGFHSFSWDNLRDQSYDVFDNRTVYCAGGAEGLASCSVPPTETQGQIKLSFSDTMEAASAKSLQEDRSLTFDWVTTGDNDDSDCRHTAINLKLKLRYVMPE